LGIIIKLAKALDKKMGYFISGTEEFPYTIVRKNEGKLISRFGRPISTSNRTRSSC